ncbi:MAM domain-containing protein 2 [Electrophorus electricus]|uniref:MAM domain-containing protein 2 n=1 Tax=Electrophorus electricus TaxID=8005 RepID=UPI0015D06902|nr:MAM domain-containing protein 2 [Electrophorus electricus]
MALARITAQSAHREPLRRTAELNIPLGLRFRKKMMSYFFLSLIVAVKAEILPGSCHFEGSTCDYTADPGFLSWSFSPKGRFITVEAIKDGQQEKAVLLGPEMEQQAWSCFRLVYQLIGSASLQVQRRVEKDSFDHVLWSSSSPSDSWLMVSIDLQNYSDPYKIVLEGRPGSSKDSSVSIFNVNISDKYCIECDFEESHLCGYTNQWNSNINWYVGRDTADNTTPSDGPGEQGYGHYMYVDSVYASSLQEVAKLVSPMTTVPMSGCLSFQYQQERVGSHLFQLYSRDQAGQYQELWRADGSGGNSADWGAETQVWIPVQVALRAPYPMEMVFEVSFNSVKGGHVLLDDISFSPELCSAESEAMFDPTIANCDFELDLCQYTQNKLKDSEMWKRVSVRPNIYREGDHTTGTGSFLLANSHFTLQTGYVSRLYGPQLPGDQKYCLKFFYLLRGFHQNSQALAVYLYDGERAKQNEIWTQSEKTQNIWIQVELNLQSEKNTQVVFISICNSFGNCGPVGLDDISVNLGNCELPLGFSLSVPSHCNFETGMCENTQDKQGDKADWVLTRGSTPTSYTGPKGDHTTGTGHYLYIEASLMLPGHNARLLSMLLRGSKGAQCLKFFYHMYGLGTGQLSVLLRSQPEGRDRLLWVRRGEQGISWFKASVNYQYDHQHQIVFEATRGSSIRSDIAIDDITFQKGPCKDADKQNSKDPNLSGDHNNVV